MPSINDFPARGKIIELHDSMVVFQPSGTKYQLHLQFIGDDRPVLSAQPIECLIQAEARKVYTVPSGGNFISPIFGRPKTIQGRVKYADPQTLVIQAGAPIIVKLPAADSAIDLSEGGIQVGHLANVVALRGATIQLISLPATV